MNKNLLHKIFVICIIILFIELSFYPVIGIETETALVNSQNTKDNISEKDVLEIFKIRHCFIFDFRIEGGIATGDVYYFFGYNFNFTLYGPFKVIQIFPFKIYTFNGCIHGSIKGFHGILGWGKDGYGLFVTIFGIVRYFEGTQIYT